MMMLQAATAEISPNFITFDAAEYYADAFSASHSHCRYAIEAIFFSP